MNWNIGVKKIPRFFNDYKTRSRKQNNIPNFTM